MGSAVVHDATVIANSTGEQATRVGRSRTDDMESMVDDLVGPEPMAIESPHPIKPQLSAVNGSLSSSRPASGRFTASDLVQQMQQSSPAPPPASPAISSTHRISLPGVWKTPFTPRPGETNGASSRPSSSHHVAHDAATPTAIEHTLSQDAMAFQHQIAQTRQNIQNRSSPIQGFDPTITPASNFQTPTGFDTFVRQNASDQSSSLPWVSSANTSSATGTEVPHQAAQASPYGAIGEPRPKSAKTPTSYQPG